MDTASNQALRKAVDLLADPPADPDVSRGYLDLLGEGSGAPKNSGFIQKAWASQVGSMLYDHAQLLNRRVLAASRPPIDWLEIPAGGVALDVGSGPGNITSALARAMTSVIRDAGLRARLAAAGPEVAGHYTWERTASQHIDVYRRLARDPAPLAG